MPKAFLQICLSIGASLLGSNLTSQEPGSVSDMFAPASKTSELTVETIFGNNELMPRRVGTIVWMGDSSFTICEPAKGGNQIVRYEAQTGNSQVLVTAAQLTPVGQPNALIVSDYQWSTDFTKLLISVRTDITRLTYADAEHGPMEHWVLDLPSGKLTRLGDGATEIRFPKFNPSASEVAYLREQDIWLENLNHGKPRRLTFGGSANLFHGCGDWHYSNEWNLADAFRWSPDGKSIAFLEVDTSAVAEYVDANSIAELYPKTRSFTFAKAGTIIPQARIGVVASAGGEPSWITLPDGDVDHYLPWFEWSASGEILVQKLNRAQTQLRLYAVDPQRGDARLLVEENDPAWVEPGSHFQWSLDRSAFTWLSERDGWRHLWSVPVNGKAQLLTVGDYDVMQLLQIDQEFAWFLATPENPTKCFLFRVPISGGEAECMTPAQEGWHEYQFSQNGKWAIYRSSKIGDPPRTELISLPDHRVHSQIESNQSVRDALVELGTGEHGFVRIETEDGIAMDGWMMMPPDFDSKKMYPVVLHVNGEPDAQTVADRWGGMTYLWHLVLAHRGYVILGLDNRGSNVPRGRDWRRSAHGDLGTMAAVDQASAVQALCWQNPWLDSGRIGVWGQGGGGSTALHCMFRMPDTFSAGIAVSFSADRRYASAITQERYLGTPQQNESAYAKSSPVGQVLGLSDPLLLIHGTSDPRNHYQNCQRLTDELIRLGLQFDMIAYPNGGEDFRHGLGTSAHYYNTMLRWWLNNLSPESRKPALMM